MAVVFDRIPFQLVKGNYSHEDVRKAETYAQFIRENEVPDQERQEYEVDGDTQYLLSRPMLPERKNHLAYIQSYSYMESGSKYYTKRDSYDSFLILYTYDGAGSLEYEGESYTLRAGEGFIIDCRKAHRYKTEGKLWVHGDLHIWGGNTEYLYSEFIKTASPLFRPQHPNGFQSVLEESLRAHSSISPSGDLAVSVLLGDLLKMICEDLSGPAKGAVPEGISSVQQYIGQHYTEDMSVDDLAQIAHMSKYHLIRQFRRFTGFTPHDYMIRLRLSQAESMLLLTDLPSYKIGALLGFATEANFIQHFKRVYGTTPGRARGKQSDLF